MSLTDQNKHLFCCYLKSCLYYCMYLSINADFDIGFFFLKRKIIATMIKNQIGCLVLHVSTVNDSMIPKIQCYIELFAILHMKDRLEMLLKSL
jgi:hypothetical protein